MKRIWPTRVPTLRQRRELSDASKPPKPETGSWHQDQHRFRCQIVDEADCNSPSGDKGMLYPPRCEEVFSHEKFLTPRRQERRWCRLFEVPAPQAANSIQELQIENRH
jgi:hypothetical protein